jgi:hypothetical protein
VIHIGFSSIARRFGEIHGVPILCTTDNLAVGPTSADPSLHREARVSYWGGETWRTEADVELEQPGGPALCFWFEPTTPNMLAFWRACSLCALTGRRVWRARLGRARRRKNPRGTPTWEPEVTEEDLAAAPPTPSGMARGQVRALAAFWAAYCAKSPEALWRITSRSRRAEVLDLRLYYAGFFPRRLGAALRLSRLDELLLGLVGRTWSTPAAIIARGVEKGGATWLSWLSRTGSQFVARRLRGWSERADGKVLHRRIELPGQRQYLICNSYRLAPGGEAILRRLPSLAFAPRVAIGGATAYDPEDPWCLRVAPSGSVAWERAR